MIKFKNVDFFYENKKVLDNINFEIPKDKRKIAILGENGSGKSTLFLLMNGILKKKSGQIFIDGEELDYSKEIDRNKEKSWNSFSRPRNSNYSTNSFSRNGLWA